MASEFAWPAGKSVCRESLRRRRGADRRGGSETFARRRAHAVPSMKLEKYTVGTGDRFAHQGEAQLRAVQRANEAGCKVHPVWNKSNREHTIIGSRPDDLRVEADAAVQALGWTGAYYVDADHIGLGTVDGFLAASDFYTVDVADFTGKAADDDKVERFVAAVGQYSEPLTIPGIDRPLELTKNHRARGGGKVPAGRAGSRAGLPAHRRPAGPRQLRHRAFHRRDRLAADTPRTVPDPGDGCTGGSAAPDDCAEVHRPLQQGRRLRRRSCALRAGV